MISFGKFILDSNIPFRLYNHKTLKKSLRLIKSTDKIPNTLLSLLCFKKFNCHSIIVKHKKRETGTVWITSFKLYKFCLSAVYELISFKFKRFTNF